jgi:hypothetical protein
VDLAISQNVNQLLGSFDLSFHSNCPFGRPHLKGMGLSVNRKKHFFLFSFLSHHDYVGMVLATLNETESQKGLPQMRFLIRIILSIG